MTLQEFQKTKNYLICVDSDGCAMDTMDIKHFRCFGPCLVEEWRLEAWEDSILKRWNEINLYTMTRGVNRFKGLALILREVDAQDTPIEGLADLIKWTETSRELSNRALQEEVRRTGSVCLQKALSWSQKVNVRINALPFSEKKPFAGVKEALAYAHQFADVAVVSSANLQAVLEEWERYGLLEDVDLVLAQDTGSKAFCLRELLHKGYEQRRVLMAGDAPGDRDAAAQNGVCFYPILVRHERESWVEFRETAVRKLLAGRYQGLYQQGKLDAFVNNLK